MPVDKSKNKKIVTVLPNDIAARLENVCNYVDRSMSNFIRVTVIREIERLEKSMVINSNNSKKNRK